MNMKIATFNYTDVKGKQSNRTVLVTGMPTDKVSGYDLGELDEEDQGDFAAQLDSLHEQYLDNVNLVLEAFRMKNSYRQFFENKMTDKVYESI